MNESSEHLPEDYTVVVGARPFVLSQSQIERDSPNYFTRCLLNPSRRPNNNRIEISRDPHMFELVLKYLNGYRVVPIHESLVPATSTVRTMLADLRADGEFYQLRGLVELCTREEEQSEELLVHYAIATGYIWIHRGWGCLPHHSVEEFVDRFHLSPLSEVQYEKATADMQAWNDTTLNSPQVLATYGWSHNIVKRRLHKNAPSIDKWEIVGWKQHDEENLRQMVIFLKIRARREDVLY